MNPLQLIAHCSGKLEQVHRSLLAQAPRHYAAGLILLFCAVIGCFAGSHFDSGLAGYVAANAAAAAFTFTPVMGMKTLELISYSATQPNTGAAAAALAGDSLVIKNQGVDKPAQIVNWWADNQVLGSHQLVFPSGHDTTRGLRLRVRASDVTPLLPDGVAIEVQNQEQLAVTIVGSNTAGDVENGAFLVAYERIPGIMPRNIDWPEFRRRATKLVSVELTIAGAAAGYTGAEAINVESDLLLPNQDYALMGAISSLESCTIAIVGPDTGNVKIGLPAADLDTPATANFFLRLARAHGEPFIPVINSGNKANTLVSIVQDENNISPVISLMFALLKK